jgi:hypothetical protein
MPKVIRDQISYLVLLKSSDPRTLNLIISQIDTDVEPVIIKKVIKNATKHELNVCIINLNSRNINETFRRNITNPQKNGFDYYTLEDNNGNNLDIENIELFDNSGIIN